MTFSFNFNVESGGENVETISQDVEKKEDDTQVKWKEAREHFVEEQHKNEVTISNVQNFDQFKLDSDTSVAILNSDSVTFRLRTSDYSGDLEPALLHNTDLVPGQYEVSGSIIDPSSQTFVREV